ncbi:MAG: hypothetical protein LBF72_02315 [Holosporales bacterium]|nr:hypothetical protein [Holosporales bacterium]
MSSAYSTALRLCDVSTARKLSMIGYKLLANHNGEIRIGQEMRVRKRGRSSISKRA